MSVLQRHKNWWNEVLWKPKKAHSLEQLKFQHQVLQRNTVVTDHNRQLLVETFRSIAEILIWGDQNDSRVFDFFLEKNMQSFFLRTLTQRCGRFVCVQLLQTLNILFENIRNETAIYYLLSNNHVNSIIVLKLDFSDEEVLAYYISFLKTLSFKLNTHTIHFFYNEHLRDFPLYTEAIKFFNHSESMVRIAVRTLTLNVYKVNDKNMLEFIRNKTAAPYFSNLVWFIGNHIIELDECLISQAHHLNRGRLEQSVAEHLDHLHYIGDILSLGVEPLNEVLVDHLLNRLLIPLYVYSLSDQAWPEEEESPRISSKIALFLLSQVFLTLTHATVITPLTYFIFTGDTTLTLPPSLSSDSQTTGNKRDSASYSSVCAFVRPTTTLELSLKKEIVPGAHGYVPAKPVSVRNKIFKDEGEASYTEGSSTESMSHMHQARSDSVDGYTDTVIDHQYVLIEASPPSERFKRVSQGYSGSQSESQSGSQSESHSSPEGQSPPKKSPIKKSPAKKAKTPPRSPDHQMDIPVVSTVFLDALMGALSVRSDDTKCLFALALIYSLVKNKGVHPRLLEAFSLTPLSQGSKQGYNNEVITLILSILDSSTVTSNCLRLVTLKMATMVLRLLLGMDSPSSPDSHETALQDHHIALIESIYESSVYQLRLFYKGLMDEIFLDMFEDEYHNEKNFGLKVPYLMMDASMLLPPTDTPLTGIDFTRRLPCGENERARKAMRVFFAVRLLSQQMSQLEERELPLTMPNNSGQIGDVVDLKNCDLVSCIVTIGDKSESHFMVVTETEFLLVDPDKSRLGWGIINFIAFLQDVDISPDPANVRALFVTVRSRSSKQKKPSLSGNFQFEDYIRCLAAKQSLIRARDKLRLAKMTRIAKILHYPIGDIQPTSLAIPNLPSPEKGVLSLTPTPENEPHSMSMSAAHFVSPGESQTNTQVQEGIEMSALRVSTLVHNHSDEDNILDSSIRLSMPTSELELDPTRLEVRFHRDKSSSRSTSVEAEILELSEPEDSFQSTAEPGEAKAMGYSVTQMGRAAKRKQERADEEERTVGSGPVTIVISDEGTEIDIVMDGTSKTDETPPTNVSQECNVDSVIPDDSHKDPSDHAHKGHNDRTHKEPSEHSHEDVGIDAQPVNSSHDDISVTHSEKVSTELVLDGGIVTLSAETTNGETPLITDSIDSGRDPSEGYKEDTNLISSEGLASVEALLNADSADSSKDATDGYIQSVVTDSNGIIAHGETPVITDSSNFSRNTLEGHENTDTQNINAGGEAPFITDSSHKETIGSHEETTDVMNGTPAIDLTDTTNDTSVSSAANGDVPLVKHPLSTVISDLEGF